MAGETVVYLQASCKLLTLFGLVLMFLPQFPLFLPWNLACNSMSYQFLHLTGIESEGRGS